MLLNFCLRCNQESDREQDFFGILEKVFVHSCQTLTIPISLMVLPFGNVRTAFLSSAIQGGNKAFL